MIPVAKDFLHTRRGYVIVAILMGILGIAARYWTPNPGMAIDTFVDPFGENEEIHVVGAWVERAQGYEGYWISQGGSVGCWISLRDEDTWTDENTYQYGTEDDEIDWNNVVWTQTNGNWDNSCNGTGASVTWWANDNADFGWINVVQLDDYGELPENDNGNRQDGPQVEYKRASINKLYSSSRPRS